MVAVVAGMDAEDRMTERERLAPLVYRVPEVAELLGVSTRTVYLMVQERQIPHLRLGVAGSTKPSIVFPKAALEQWMTSRALADVAQ